MLNIKVMKVLALTLVFCFAFPAVCFASQSYPSYTTDNQNNIIPVSNPYQPVSVRIALIGDTPDMLRPSDLFIDQEDNLYIVDTGNNRILVFDDEYRPILNFGKDLLNNPNGICVTDDAIYVADSGNLRVAIFDRQGVFLREITKPQSDLIAESEQFVPQKLVVDDRGYMYIACEGNENGLYMLDLKGNFRGYFGANRTELTLIDSLIRLFYNREQRSGKVVKLPFSYVNVGLMNDYIYASTTGASINQIRRLSPSGGDVLFSGKSKNFYDAAVNAAKKQNFVDFTVDRQGNLTVLDETSGRIYQYDNEGKLLFAFGDISVNRGCFLKPSSIASNSKGELIILDSERADIQVFEPTLFTETIHTANALYAAGKYSQAMVHWQNVLKVNSQYVIAQEAMGRIYFKLQDYENALYYARISNDKEGYSKAFAKSRDLFVTRNFNIISLLIVLLFMIIAWLKSFFKKRRKKLKDHHFVSKSLLSKSFYIMFHPFDAFQDFKYKKAASYRDMFILLSAYIIVKVISIIMTAFLFRTAPLEQTDWWSAIALCIAPYLLLCIANYGLTTLADGRGTFKEVMAGGAFCLTPLIYFTLPVSLLTNVISLEESGFLNIILFISWFLVLFLAFVFQQEVHNYSISQSITAMILTCLGAVVLACLIVIAFGLFGQLTDFVAQIFREVVILAS